MKGPLIHLTIGKANPERANGINVIVHGLATAFQERGLPIEVWGLTPTPAAPTFERPYPLRLFQLPARRFGVDAELRAALEQLPKSAIVHFHGGLLPEFYGLARVLRRRRIPWVLMPHGSYSKAALGRGGLRKRAYIALFDRLLIRGAARIQLGHANSANGLRDRILAPRAIVIPNGFMVPKGPFATLDSRPFRFVYCGRLAAYHKGLDLLARGFVQAQEAGVEMQLDLIGAGPDREAIESILSHPSTVHKAQLHGALFGEAKQAVLRSASCMLLTSRHEGFPMALLEAAALGLPLLVSEGTHFADYVRRLDCGMVLPELSERSIAEGLLAMASVSPDRLREMSTNSVRLILRELSWKRIAERIEEEIYRPIAEARS